MITIVAGALAGATYVSYVADAPGKNDLGQLSPHFCPQNHEKNKMVCFQWLRFKIICDAEIVTRTFNQERVQRLALSWACQMDP
jgi:hypothetical protein